MSNPLQHENITRILWISDIHIREAYTKELNFNKFTEAFQTFYKEQNEDSEHPPIAYILISGDIANAGLEAEYKVFWDKFIKGIHQYHCESKKEFPRILTIPGNHDVNRGNKIFKDFLDANLKNNYEINKFLGGEKTREEFKSCFADYSKFFGPENNDKVWQDLFKFDGNTFEVCEHFNQNRLFGYLIDKKNKLIFIFINSSWLAIGKEFNTLLAAHKARGLTGDIEYSHAQTRFKEILDEKDRYGEYGNQIIGRVLFSENELDKLYRLSNEFTLITACHHGLSWLHPAELYSDDETIMNDLKLHQILSHSDVVCTSHEHIPINTPPYSANGSYVNLKSGKFMDDNILESEGRAVLKYCWLSILEIRCRKNIHTISQSRYQYAKKEQKWNKYPNEKTIPKIICQKEKRRILQDTDISKISEIFSALSCGELASMLNAIPGKIAGADTLKEIIKTNNYRVFESKKEEYTDLIILPLNQHSSKEIFPSKIADDYFLIQYLHKIYVDAGISLKTINVNTIWSDLLVDEELAEKYKDSENNFDEIANKISRRCEFMFQLFIHQLETWQKNNAADKKVWFLQWINKTLPFEWLVSQLGKYLHQIK